MRRFGVAIALVVWTALALPTAMAAELPWTVSEQAEWCGDLFVARVCEDCQMEVPQALTAGAREELVRGMKQVLSGPLSMEDLVRFAQWLSSGLPCSPGELPFELQLRAKARAGVGRLSAYLTEERPDFVEGCEVLGQFGALLEFLEECLEQELAGVVSDERGAARSIGASIFAFSAWPTVSLLADPFSPAGKRLLTEEEMAGLQERAAYWARGARSTWQSFRTGPFGEGLLDGDPELMLELGMKSAVAAHVFVQDVLHTYAEPVRWLTAEEDALLSAQIAAWKEARRAAEEGGAWEDAREAAEEGGGQ
jgi:hypothetical protein